LLPDLSIAELLVDKSKMTELLKNLDIVPPSVEFSSDDLDFNNVFDKLPTPFWVRSTSGTSGLGSLRVENKAALKNWVQINPGVKYFLASQFLSGRNLACKMLYYQGKLLRAACGERVNYIMAKVAPSGITGNTSFGRLLNEPKLVEVAIKAMDFLFAYSNAARHGFYTVDFKEDENGKPYITEINVRHVAFTQCFAAAGANFAEDTIRLLDEDPAYDKNFKMYEFEVGQIFLRDVDALPILMKETDLLK
jgi:carbamoyl-phosphate synthase large subunit